jgi:hypothetical protein
MRSTRVAAGMALALAVFIQAAHAQSISPSTVNATMTVGQTLIINKTITLPATGANLVDLFFLADNTGSMGGIITNAQNGASAILGGLPSGINYNFGVGRYFGDPVEGVPPSTAYQTLTPLTSSASAAQTGINGWFASGGGDFPEANFFALQQVANTTAWRTGSQRIVVWFGDAPSHTATTTQAQAIAALQAQGATVIAFNSVGAGTGIDCQSETSCTSSVAGQASGLVAGVGNNSTLTNNFNSLTSSQFVTAVNNAISTASSTLNLTFGHTLASSGLTLVLTCTDPLGCNNVSGGDTRQFQLAITANTVGTYNFQVFANGVSAFETDVITVNPAGVVPEPSTWALLGTGLIGLGAFGRRRRQQNAA